MNSVLTSLGFQGLGDPVAGPPAMNMNGVGPMNNCVGGMMNGVVGGMNSTTSTGGMNGMNAGTTNMSGMNAGTTNMSGMTGAAMNGTLNGTGMNGMNPSAGNLVTGLNGAGLNGAGMNSAMHGMTGRNGAAMNGTCTTMNGMNNSVNSGMNNPMNSGSEEDSLAAFLNEAMYGGSTTSGNNASSTSITSSITSTTSTVTDLDIMNNMLNSLGGSSLDGSLGVANLAMPGNMPGNINLASPACSGAHNAHNNPRSFPMPAMPGNMPGNNNQAPLSSLLMAPPTATMGGPTCGTSHATKVVGPPNPLCPGPGLSDLSAMAMAPQQLETAANAMGLDDRKLTQNLNGTVYYDNTRTTRVDTGLLQRLKSASSSAKDASVACGNGASAAPGAKDDTTPGGSIHRIDPFAF